MHQSHWRHPLSLLVRLVPLHGKVRNRCQQLCDGSASESSSRWCPLPGVSFCHVTTADHFTADLLSEQVKQQKKDVKCLRVYSLQAFYVLSLLYTFAHDSFQFQSWFQRNGFDSLRSLPVELKKTTKKTEEDQLRNRLQWTNAGLILCLNWLILVAAHPLHIHLFFYSHNH